MNVNWSDFKFGFVLGVLVSLLVYSLFGLGSAISRTTVDPDLQNIQKQRNAWRLYQEATK